MKYIYIILLFLPFTIYSQSIKVDSPKGLMSDLDTAARPIVSTDLVVVVRNDSSLVMTFDIFTDIPHGAFAFHDSSTTLTMSTGVWSMITNAWNTLFTQEDAKFLTFAGDSVTLTSDGDYISIASISFGGTAGDNYEFAYFKNGALVDYSTLERTTSQTDVGNLSLPVYLFEIVAGDDITIKVRNTASDDDATIVSVSWIIWRLHI